MKRVFSLENIYSKLMMRVLYRRLDNKELETYLNGKFIMRWHFKVNCDVVNRNLFLD